MPYLLRSMLFIPAYNEKFLLKAPETDADAIVLDLEDACPLEKEAEGRELIRRILTNGVLKGRQVVIRINELGTESLHADLTLLDCPGILGLIPPKVSSAKDLKEFDRLVTEKEKEYGLVPNSISFIPLIETAGGVLHVNEIAGASVRNIAIGFGGEDFLDSVWGVHDEPPKAFDVPRAMVVMAARENGLLPIDTPYLDLKNEEGYRQEEQKSATMGFGGHFLLNPRQVPWANEVFSPTAEEIAQARRIVAAVAEVRQNGGSIAVLDGKMIGPPMHKRAEKVVALAELIEKNNRHGL